MIDPGTTQRAPNAGRSPEKLRLRHLAARANPRSGLVRALRPCLACWNGARSPSEAGIRGISGQGKRCQEPFRALRHATALPSFPMSRSHVSTRCRIFATASIVELDIGRTLEHFRDRYIAHLPAEIDFVGDRIVADVGCGYGWLAMAFALWTDARVVAIDIDAPRLQAARQIARILGLEDRIDWRVGGVSRIPLHKREAEIVYCIEVLEHVQRDRRALEELQRVADHYLIVTTPNLWCPIIAHDTRLPLCHWLPMWLRDVYADLCRRRGLQHGNLFWSPWSLDRGTRRIRTDITLFAFSEHGRLYRDVSVLLAVRRGVDDDARRPRNLCLPLADGAARSSFPRPDAQSGRHVPAQAGVSWQVFDEIGLNREPARWGWTRQFALDPAARRSDSPPQCASRRRTAPATGWPSG